MFLFIFLLPPPPSSSTMSLTIAFVAHRRRHPLLSPRTTVILMLPSEKKAPPYLWWRLCRSMTPITVVGGRETSLHRFRHGTRERGRASSSPFRFKSGPNWHILKKINKQRERFFTSWLIFHVIFLLVD